MGKIATICQEEGSVVAIIGGGFSGTMLAVQLMRQHTAGPLTVVLVERAPRLGRGIAYGTPSRHQLLNVPAGKMSGFLDQPDHFLTWARARDPRVTPASFMPRPVYAEYLAELLDRAHCNRPPGLRFERVWDEAVAVEEITGEHRLVIRLRSGRVVRAGRVVLAMGNFAPANPPIADMAFYASDRYVRDPWSAGVFASLDRDEPLLFIGTGLTMVDKLIELRACGHCRPVHALSRHGLLPRVHRLGVTAMPPPTFPAGTPAVRTLYRAVRQAITEAAATGGDWRSVLDALRPIAQETWQALPFEEKRRFLRHLRPYWEVHRHRIAPEVGVEVERQSRSGQLQVHAGYLLSFHEDATGVDVCYRPRGHPTQRTLRVARVVNCSGPSTSVQRIDEPLLTGLCAHGMIRPDHLGLGIEVDAQGAVLDATGRPSDRLYTIGPLRKGYLWETTAVPELRCQADQLARTLLAEPSRVCSRHPS